MPKWEIVVRGDVKFDRMATTGHPHDKYDNVLYVEGDIISVADVPYDQIPKSYRRTSFPEENRPNRVYLLRAAGPEDFTIVYTGESI